MKLIQKLISQVVVFLVILSTIFPLSSVVKANEGAATKELKNVISGINIIDVSEGKALSPDANGEYKLYENKSYRYEVSFDLKKYDGKLNDGDYFNFTIPAPFDVNDGATVPLIDSSTNLEVGTAIVTRNPLGQRKGGTVRVTLKNLDEYLNKKGGVQVQDVKGTFYTDFNSSEIMDRKEINYKVSETVKPINHTIKILKREKSDYTEGIKNENFIKFGGILNTKDPYDSKILGKKGEYAHSWFLRVNTNQSSYDKIVLKDQILDSYAPMQHIPEKFSVVAGAFDSSLNLQNSTELKRDIDYTIEYNESYTEYTLTILKANKRLINGKPASYNVFYKTTSPADGSIVGNKIEVTGDGTPLTIGKDTTKTEHIVTRSSKIVEGGNITIDTGYRIILYKTDEKTADLLPGAKFKITTPSGQTSIITTDENGRAYSEIYSSEEVSKGEFIIEEIEAPAGYEKITEQIKVTVGKEGVVKTIKNKRIKTEIPVTKSWEDNNNQDGKRPTEIIVNLLANGNKVEGKTLVLNEANNWKGIFTELDKFDRDGKEITYTITEDKVEGYTTEINGYNITNKYTPEVTQISGEKTWEDGNNQDGKRPDKIKVNLLANGEVIQSKEVSEKDNWKYEFTNLPKYKDGKEITYTITEDKVEGYTTEINGYNITNKYTPEVTQISGEKTWEDGNNQDGKRPDKIKVNLLANGEVIQSKEVSSQDNWKYEFTNLPKYKDGKEITYTITEDKVEGYTTEINGYNITNKYVPEKPKSSLSKTGEASSGSSGLGMSVLMLAMIVVLRKSYK
ncbi:MULTISPECIES: Cna B-type domain-containing protein [unclassified Gemella]|uniref:Cna B-type domain-containing protein n=1 Tax=unclassified Gemella TaxID=2624949 RepID=UPI001C54E8A2|nr:MULTISPECIES: Cna B-type domain-containing protein [unclassified Gemella]